MRTYQEFKKEALKKPKVKEFYNALEEEFKLKSKLIELRKIANLTQEELALRMHTTRSAISRLESFNSKNSPTLATLQSYAKALGKNVRIDFV